MPSNEREAIGEDHLSHLPIDCLLDVFKRVNHDDLDEISTLSKMIHQLAEFARPQAVKMIAKCLTVVQNNPLLFSFTIEYGECEYFLKISETSADTAIKMTRILEIDQWDWCYIDPQPQKIASVITECATISLRRFEFENLLIDSVSIDDHVLSFIEPMMSTNSFDSFNLGQCVFDPNLSSGGRKRFLSILIAARPSGLRLYFKSQRDANIIDESFLREYAELGELPLLDITVDDDDTPIHASYDFAQTISKFKLFVYPRLVVNTTGEPGRSSFIVAVAQRLRHECAGGWCFRLTREVDQREVEAVLGRDVDITFESGTEEKVLKLKGHGFGATLIWPVNFVPSMSQIDFDLWFH